ncbi:MAG: amidohydrolase family protein [Armatimonadota bacterium]
MIIDCHTHIFPEKVVENAMGSLGEMYGVAPVVMPTADNLRAHMDECGVDKSVICPVATKPDQVPSINRWVAGLDRKRIIPFGALHPAYKDNEGEIEFLLDSDIRGIKLQPFFQHFELITDATDRLLNQVGDRLFIIMHAGDEMVHQEHIEPNPQRLAKLVEMYPFLRMSAAHLGGYRVWDDVEEHLVGRELYFDLSYTFNQASDERIMRVIENHGYERILWASDFPWQSQCESLEGLKRLPLTDEVKQDILSGNIRREIGL